MLKVATQNAFLRQAMHRGINTRLRTVQQMAPVITIEHGCSFQPNRMHSLNGASSFLCNDKEEQRKTDSTAVLLRRNAGLEGLFIHDPWKCDDIPVDSRAPTMSLIRPRSVGSGRRYFSTMMVEEEEKKKKRKDSQSTNKAASDNGLTNQPIKTNPAPRKRAVKQIKQQEVKLNTALEKGGQKAFRLNEQLPKFSERVGAAIKHTPVAIYNVSKTIVGGGVILVTDPARAMAYAREMKQKVVAEIKHYWLGSKLLYAEFSTSTRILRRVLQGYALTRRERKQLQRSVADLLRLVPFSFFIIVPFMEFLLPFALRLFPNMLPSTFKDSFTREEEMKKKLTLRLSLAEFLQDTIKDAMNVTRDTEGASEEKIASAKEVLTFVERAQNGESLTGDEIMKFASLFNDELMLDNISRPQLAAMCTYMGLQPFGTDNFLRFQIRNKIRQLKKDDQDIIWEGIDTLTKEELQLACMERGMRSTGLSKGRYHKQLKQWLDLSINRNVPSSLLIISRALSINNTERPEEAIATSMSSLDEVVIKEVALQVAASTSEKSPELTELKLESIRYQNELIADEEKDRLEEALKKKEVDEVEKAIAAQATVQASTASTAQATATATASTASSESLVGSPELSLTSHAEKLFQEVSLSARPEETLKAEPFMVDIAKPSMDEIREPVERQLTLAEVSALESMVFKSSVEKERQVLDSIKQSKSAMDVESLLAAGRIGTQGREDKTTDRMRKKLDAMITNIEMELEKVDKSIGSRLNVLDQDNDGIITDAELKAAVRDYLRAHNTETDVDWVVQQIDQDKDGKISRHELVEWIEKKAQLHESAGSPKPSSRKG